jgi:sulfoxide reductase catalytic subunit YedY
MQQLLQRQLLTAPRNMRYDAARPITEEREITNFNNYYEFGQSKFIADAAAALKITPWTIELAGMVARPRTLGYDELLRQVKLEERVYRHRCVEAWAMTVPWTGFPLADFVKLAEPTGSATYVKFTTVVDQQTMPGLRQAWYPWPYTEGLTMDEAMNELSFLTIGMYGKTLPPQNGAPIRLTVPRKYGF